MPVPPGVARAVLRLVVPSAEIDVAEGELNEGYQGRAATAGESVARRWYRRQVLGYVWRVVAVRRYNRGKTNEEGGMSWFGDVWGDVRWAGRALRRRPAFTAVAVLTLALGIGANSAIFTLVNAHFFEPLPYDNPDELVLLWETGRDNLEVTTVAPGNYWVWRDEAESFVDIAAYNVSSATLSGEGGAAERVAASLVAPHFFDVLGAEPLLGSTFSEASVREADAFQVVLGHSLWQRRFGADPGIVGKEIRVDGRPNTVVGVMPARYRQPERSLSWQQTELWQPLVIDDQRGIHGSRYLRTIARRKPGVGVEAAREEMEAMAARLAEQFPNDNGGRTVLVRTLDEYLLGDARPTLLMLLFAGAAVLLIVCANVANLTLARGEERKREFAVRAALGSGGPRLVRQIVVEGLLLAVFGALVGTVLVYVASDVLQVVQTRFFSGLVDVSVDARVILATTGLALAAGIIFGLPLARSATRPELSRALVEGGERAGSAKSDATRNLLIIGQVGMATTLLVVATLLSRSFAELVSVPPGFDSDGVVTFTVSPSSVDYPEADDVLRYHRDLLAEVEAIPGVAGVGPVSDLMFTGENMFTTFVLDGQEHDPERPPRAEYHIVVPEYFEVLDIPVRSGQLPTRWSEGEELPVAVSERMAEVFWPGADPLGMGMTLDWADPIRLRVVAVVGDVLDDGYDGIAEPAFFLPFAQMPRRRMSYLVRVAGDPAPVFAGIRAAVGRIDADVPAGDLRLLSTMMAESVARPRAASLIGLAFACLALLVATAGIYGVLSYAVQRRTREIGIRSALGASGSQLVSMVMGQSTRLVALGLVVGAIGALIAGRALSGLLFGVKSWDPVSLIGASLVLGAVATLAAWIPARRAIGIDPKEALRAE